MTRSLREKLENMPDNRTVARQVAALCIDGATGKVLLITSRGTGRWIIPKGWPIEGRSMAGSAMQEAWEEAGVKGVIEEEAIGDYCYEKVPGRGSVVPIVVQVYRMRVKELAKEYPERNQRQRKWFSLRKAADLISEPELKDMLRGLAG